MAFLLIFKWILFWKRENHVCRSLIEEERLQSALFSTQMSHQRSAMFVCFLGFMGISVTFVMNITVTVVGSDRLPNLHYAVTHQRFVALHCIFEDRIFFVCDVNHLTIILLHLLLMWNLWGNDIIWLKPVVLLCLKVFANNQRFQCSIFQHQGKNN